MKTGLVVLAGVAWIGCGPFLARFMSKRGYDAFSWLSVGALLGPAALALALMERLSWTQPLPEIVVRGDRNGGSIDVLVLMDDGADVVPVAGPLLEWFQTCLGRLTIARVLPEAGPLEERVLASRALTQTIERVAPRSAEGMLLFGARRAAVGSAVRDAGFHVVITARPDRAVKEAVRGTEVVHVDGPQYVRELKPRSKRRGPSPRRTTSNWTRR